MQWPLTSQLHGSVSQREQLVFFVMDQTPHPNDGESFIHTQNKGIDKLARTGEIQYKPNKVDKTQCLNSRTGEKHWQESPWQTWQSYNKTFLTIAFCPFA
jgi:hypothetical protein